MKKEQKNNPSSVVNIDSANANLIHTPVEEQITKQSTEEELALRLLQINQKLDHKKQTKDLTLEEIKQYHELTNILEEVADLYHVQVINLVTNKTTKETLELKNKCGDLLIKSSMLLNASLAIKNKRNLFNKSEEITNLTSRITQIEKYFVTNIIGKTQDDLEKINYDPQSIWQENQVKYKTTLINLRKATEEKLAASESPQAISSFIATELKEFLKLQIKNCRDICGNPPCAYSIVLLGSLAKESATPYSDLEFAIIIDEEHKDNQQSKQYFRNLTRLLNFRINNLGESIIPQSWYSTSFDNAYTMGFGFDLGGKTPLNRKRTEEDEMQSGYPAGSDKYDLIATPLQMLEYSKDENNYYSNIDKFLPGEVSSVSHLTSYRKKGTESPFEEYQQQLDEFEKQIDETTGKTHSQLRSMKMMYVGVEQYNPNEGTTTKIKSDLEKYNPDMKSEGAIYQIKQDIYRLPDRLIEGLASFYGINTRGISSWKLIEELKQRDIITQEAEKNLKTMLDIAVQIRLEVDLKNVGQGGVVEIFRGDQDKDTATNHFSETQEQLLEEFYFIALPFYKKVNEFYGLKDEKIRFEEGSFFKNESFFNDSFLQKAVINRRFLRYKEAEINYTKAVEKEGVDKNNIEYLEGYGDVLHDLGKYSDAIDFFKKALEIIKKDKSEDHKSICAILNKIGSSYYDQNLYEKALECFEEALKIEKETLCSHDQKLTATLFNIANVYYAQNNYAEALKLYQQGLKDKESIFGSDHLNIAGNLEAIGAIYYEQDKYQNALDNFKKVLEIRKKKFGNNHPNIANVINSIGNVYYQTKNSSEALEYYYRALEIITTTFGDNHPSRALHLNCIGLVYYQQEDYKKARDFFWQALKQKENSNIGTVALGNIAKTYGSEGVAFYENEKYPEALDFFKKELQIREEQLEHNPQDIAKVTENIGNVFFRKENYEEALEYLHRSLEIRKNNNEDIAQIKNKIAVIANIYSEQGVAFYENKKYPEALDFFKKELQIREEQLEHNPQDIARVTENIGNVFFMKKDYESALSYYQKALTHKKELNIDYQSITTMLSSIADTYGKKGVAFYGNKEYPEALASFKAASKIIEEQLEYNPKRVAMVTENIGNVFFAQTDYDNALSYYQKALSIKKNNNEDVTQIESMIADTNSARSSLPGIGSPNTVARNPEISPLYVASRPNTQE